MEATFRPSACHLEMLRTVIFPFFVCGGETWSVAAQEEGEGVRGRVLGGYVGLVGGRK